MNATLKMNTAASAAQTVQNVLTLAYTRLSAVAGDIRNALQLERDVQRAIDDLASMNERQLRDIGLMRSDIEGAVRGSLRGDSPIGC